MDEDSNRMDEDERPEDAGPADRKLYSNPRQAQEDDEEVRPAELAAPEPADDVEIRWEDAPAAPAIESGASLRPEALFLSSPTLLDANVTTAQIMTWINTYVQGCKGLEWISDTSCALVFNSAETALAALRSLLVSSAVEEEIKGISEAYERLSNIYDPPQAADIETLGKARPVRPFRRQADESLPAPFIRIALLTDVKPKKASGKSRFYEKNGTRAGKATAELADRIGGFARRDDRDSRQEDLERLDRELDAMRSRTEDDSLRENDVGRRGRRGRSPDGGRDRKRDYSRERQKRDALDAELDAFVGRESPEAEEPRKAPVPLEGRPDLMSPPRPRETMVSSKLWDAAGELDPTESGDFVGYRETAPKKKLNYGRTHGW